MNRRNFIKVMGLGVGGVALNSTLVSCEKQEADKMYSRAALDSTQNDIRFKVLAYAMLCPNPHNKQPWVIELTGPMTFNLYVDRDRLLPATDPFYRQIHIGQGTFLEMLSIAATGMGLQANIKYFPQGIYSNTEILNKPVASIELIKDTRGEVDPLFSHIMARHSNKREYENKGLSQNEINLLRNFHGSQKISRLEIVSSSRHRQHMQQFLTEAMQIEVGNRDRDMETIKMFRFNDREVEKYRDGFGVAQTGISGIKKYLVENLFLSRESVENNPSTFGGQAVDAVRKTTESTTTFGWLSTAGNSRLDQVKVGRDYCRINLKITAMKLAMHPMSQLLQEYQEMLPLQEKFMETFHINTKNTVQMLFRLGHAEPTQHGPRRLVTGLIRD